MAVKGVLGQSNGESWKLYHGDSIEVLPQWPDECVDLSVFSPPYQSLYVYSASSRDVGNCSTVEEFYEHFSFVVKELFRITKPGRIVAVDCMNVPAMKERDGYIGLKDFRGDLIRMFQLHGFIYHSEHVVWKDPLIEAVRTKALGLMHKQLCKDSAMVRAGLPQYLLAFRKPGVNAVPIPHPDGLEWFVGEDEPKTGVIAHERWRRYASPVWMDIDSTDTLNAHHVREDDDERHLCPMSLPIIERALQLWSNPDDVVCDPFSGIGSTGYQSIILNRRFIGVELKAEYFKAAVKNLQRAEQIVTAQQALPVT